MDWRSWHDDYDRPETRLARRLTVVQNQIRAALGSFPDGPLKVISVCAGQGRDLLGALGDHPRQTDVEALLVELDERNVDIARAAATPQITVVRGDRGGLPAAMPKGRNCYLDPASQSAGSRALDRRAIRGSWV